MTEPARTKAKNGAPAPTPETKPGLPNRPQPGPDGCPSKEATWLLDVVAADQKQATSVLANFRQVAGDRPVKIAPLVARLIDPAVMAKLRGAATAEQATSSTGAAPFPEPQGTA